MPYGHFCYDSDVLLFYEVVEEIGDSESEKSKDFLIETEDTGEGKVRT